ncbi:MAG: hypothetical protein AB3N11_07345 [Arenibacterium sp.]
MRFIALLLLLVLPLGAQAQIRDSMFSDYESYQNFVDKAVYTRDFGSLIQNLGGRDEYTDEQLAATVGVFLRIFPTDFTSHAVTNVQDLGGGFRREMRVYWQAGGFGYLYYYALLHDRGDDLVVLKFTMNTDVDVIFDLY